MSANPSTLTSLGLVGLLALASPSAALPATGTSWRLDAHVVESASTSFRLLGVSDELGAGSRWFRLQGSADARALGVPDDSPFARLEIRSGAAGDLALLASTSCGTGWTGAVQARRTYARNLSGDCDTSTCPTPDQGEVDQAVAAARDLLGLLANSTCALDSSTCGTSTCKPSAPPDLILAMSSHCHDRNTGKHNCLVGITLSATGTCTCQ